MAAAPSRYIADPRFFPRQHKPKLWLVASCGLLLSSTALTAPARAQQVYSGPGQSTFIATGGTVTLDNSTPANTPALFAQGGSISGDNITVSTANPVGFGVFSQDGGLVFLTGGGTVQTSTAGSHGLAAQGGTISSTAVISTSGDGAFGAYAASLPLSTVNLTGGSVSTTGLGSYGLFATICGGCGPVGGIINSSVNVTTQGDNATVVRALFGGTVTLTGGALRSSGLNADLLLARDAGTSISATNVSGTANGAGSNGVNVATSASVSLNATTLTSFGGSGAVVAGTASFSAANGSVLGGFGAGGAGLRVTGVPTLLTIDNTTLNGTNAIRTEFTAPGQTIAITLTNGSRAEGFSGADALIVTRAAGAEDGNVILSAQGGSTLVNAITDTPTGTGRITVNLDGASNWGGSASGLGAVNLTGASIWTGGAQNIAGISLAGGSSFTGQAQNIGSFALDASQWNLAGNSAVLSLSGNSGAIVMAAASTLSAQSGLFGGVISGAGDVAKNGAGLLVLSGANTYSGSTTIAAGELRVTGSLANGLVAVQAGGTLSGTGSIGGPVTILAGGVLSAGASPGTLTVGSLSLSPGSISNFELNQPGTIGGANNDLVVVGGALGLGGTLNVLGAPSAGYYRLFNYGGALAGAFDTVNAAGFTPTVLTNIPNQVNISLLGAGQQLQFWDGADLTGNGVVDGGAGTWTPASTNWTDGTGRAGINDQWRGSVGVFQGTAGTVSVVGAQSFDTLQFNTDGYVLNQGAGGALQIGVPTGTINVSAGLATTINVPITDGGAGRALDIVGGGRLVLGGASTYTGLTSLKAGTLDLLGSLASQVSVASGATFNNRGVAGGGVTNAGLFNNSGIVNGGVNNAAMFNNLAQGVVNGGLVNSGVVSATGAINGAINNSGQFSTTAGLTNNGGVFSNTGLITLAAGNVTGFSRLDNAGVVQVTGNRTIGAGVLNNQAGGLISLINGSVNDTLNVAGSFNGSQGSRIGVDVDLRDVAGRRSDIVNVSGAANGTTALQLNILNKDGRTFSTPIDVLQVGQGSNIAISQGLVAQQGLIGYYLAESAAGSGLYQIKSNVNAAPAAGASAIFGDVISSLNTSFHQPISAIVSRPDDPAPNQLGGGPFIRITHGDNHVNSTSLASQAGGGVNSSSTTRSTSTFSGFQLGTDLGVYNIKGTGWNVNFGLMGGLFNASINSRSSAALLGGGQSFVATHATLDIPFVGPYFFISNGPFTAEFNLRRDFYDATLSSDGSNGRFINEGTKVKGRGLQFNANASYRVDVPGGWYIEPQVALSKGVYDFGALTLASAPGDQMRFATTNSILARIGANVGTAFQVTERLVLAPFVHGAVLREFSDDTKATATIAATGQSFGVATSRVGTFGQVGAGVQFKVLQSNFLGFVRGDTRFGPKTHGSAVNVGLKMQF